MSLQYQHSLTTSSQSAPAKNAAADSMKSVLHRWGRLALATFEAAVPNTMQGPNVSTKWNLLSIVSSLSARSSKRNRQFFPVLAGGNA